MSTLGSYVRERRLALNARHSGYSSRAVAQRIGIHYSYLSKLERGEHAPLTEERIRALARELGEAPDLLLALAGKITDQYSALIRKNPNRFLAFLQELELDEPEEPPAAGSYTRNLEHRKAELEELNRRLRDEIKERQALQRQLVQQESEKRIILSNLKNVVVEYIDTSFALLWASPDIQDHLGKPLDESLGEKCHKLIWNREQPCPHCTAGKAMETGTVQEGEFESRDGRKWLVRSVPILDALGHVDKVVHFGFDLSELLTVKEALEKSEQRWKFALEGAQEGVWDWDATTDKVFFSRRWKEMLGYEEHEIGDDLSEWDSRIHPEDLELCFKELRAHMRGEIPIYQSEHRLRCKDGSYKWILDRGMVVDRDDQGRPLRSIGTHFDISERKHTEEALVQSEERYRAVVEDLPGLICRFTPDGKIIFVNKAYCEYFQKSEQWLLGNSFLDLVPESEREQVKSTFASLTPESPVVTYDHCVHAPGGAIRWQSWTDRALFDQQGNTLGYQSLGRDITQEKEREHELAITKERLELAMDAGRHGFWDWDLVSNNVFYSPRYLRMLGYAPEELPHRLETWLQLLHPDEREAVNANVHERVQKMEPFTIDFRMRHKDGSWRWISGQGKSFEADEFGSPRRALGVHVDITDRKEAEEKLRQSEAFLKATFMSIQDGVSVLDVDLIVRYVNPALERWHAQDLPLVGKKCHQAFRKCNAPCDNCPTLRCLKSGKTESAIMEMPSTVEVQWVELFSYPITEEDTGRITGVVEFVRDITQRVQDEAEKKTLEQRYKTVFEKNPTVQLLIDPESGQIVNANEAACAYYGYSAEEITSLSIFDINILTQEEIQTEMQLAMRESRNFFNFRHRLKNGDIREVESRAIPVPVGAGSLLHSMIIDVTERNQALRRLEAEHARLTSLIESLPDMVCFKDAQGCWQDVNAPARKHLCLDQVEYTGRKTDDFIQFLPDHCRKALEFCEGFSQKARANSELLRVQQEIPTGPEASQEFDIIFRPLLTKDAEHEGLIIVGRNITEIKQTERQKNLLAAIIENTDNICVIKDLNLRVIATNMAFARAAGKSSVDELIGRTDAEIFGVTPDTQPVKGYMEDERQAQGLSRGEAILREEEVLLPDGGRMVVQTKKFPIHDENGAVVATANISVDITASVDARQQLEAAEKRYRRLFEEAPVGICTVDRHGNYLAVNDAHARMYGYASARDMLDDAVNSRSMFDHGEDRDYLLELLLRLGVVRDFESLMRRRDGSTFWTSRTVQGVFVADGKLDHYEAYVEDITARKEAEESAEESRKQLLNILEQLDAGVYVMRSADMRIAFANKFLSEALEKELVGEVAKDVLLADTSQCPFRLEEGNFFEQGDTVSKELLFANRRWYLCTARVCPWMDDSQAILVVAMDVTEAREAAQLKEDIERVMRHDLKTPLNGIIVLPDILLDSMQPSDDEREMLEGIRESGRKMLRLIESSLSLYKLEAGMFDLNLQPIDILQELKSIELELMDVGGSKRLHFLHTIDKEPVAAQDRFPVTADATLFPFLLSNLLKNAVEAAPDDSVITVDMCANEFFEISVHNLGAVPEKVRERFFEKYATQGKYKGTGLGTYSARLIAKAHGGEISMETSESEGTTITVTLPRLATK